MKLSIIVPVYNVELYLEKCLNSLVKQTLDPEDYEIIVVNDGSPDQSQRIIDEYQNKYPWVKGFVKENGGLSDARNFGLTKAQGKYVAFVDSDDYVDCSMYEKLLAKAESSQFDMVVCDFVEVYEDHVSRGYSCVQEDLLDTVDIKKAMCDFYPSAWNKIYKRELFDKVKFKKNVWFEDVECLYRLFPLIQSIGVVHEAFYYYVQRNGSISKSSDPRIFHCVENWNGIVDDYEQKQLLPSYRLEIEYCYVRYLYATFLKASLKYDWSTYQKAVQTAIDNVRKRFKHYRRNHYFYQSAKGIYLVLFNRYLAYLMYLVKKQKN